MGRACRRKECINSTSSINLTEWEPVQAFEGVASHENSLVAIGHPRHRTLAPHYPTPTTDRGGLGLRYAVEKLPPRIFGFRRHVTNLPRPAKGASQLSACKKRRTFPAGLAVPPRFAGWPAQPAKTKPWRHGDLAIFCVESSLCPSTTITSSTPLAQQVSIARAMHAASFNAGMITEIVVFIVWLTHTPNSEDRHSIDRD